MDTDTHTRECMHHTPRIPSSRACYTGASNTPPCCDSRHVTRGVANTMESLCSPHFTDTAKVQSNVRCMCPFSTPSRFSCHFMRLSSRIFLSRIFLRLSSRIFLRLSSRIVLRLSSRMILRLSSRIFLRLSSRIFQCRFSFCAAFRHAHTSQSCLLSVLCSVCRSPGSISMLDFSFLLKS